MSVFYVKIVKMRWRLVAKPPKPLGLRRLRVSPPDPRLCPPFCQILGCATGDDLRYFAFSSSVALGFKIFSNAALYAKSLPSPGLTLTQTGVPFFGLRYQCYTVGLSDPFLMVSLHVSPGVCVILRHNAESFCLRARATLQLATGMHAACN